MELGADPMIRVGPDRLSQSWPLFLIGTFVIFLTGLTYQDNNQHSPLLVLRANGYGMLEFEQINFGFFVSKFPSYTYAGMMSANRVDLAFFFAP